MIRGNERATETFCDLITIQSKREMGDQISKYVIGEKEGQRTFFWYDGMSDHDSLLIRDMYRSTVNPGPSTHNKAGLPVNYHSKSYELTNVLKMREHYRNTYLQGQIL